MKRKEMKKFTLIERREARYKEDCNRCKDKFRCAYCGKGY